MDQFQNCKTPLFPTSPKQSSPLQSPNRKVQTDLCIDVRGEEYNEDTFFSWLAPGSSSPQVNRHNGGVWLTNLVTRIRSQESAYNDRCSDAEYDVLSEFSLDESNPQMGEVKRNIEMVHSLFRGGFCSQSLVTICPSLADFLSTMRRERR